MIDREDVKRIEDNARDRFEKRLDDEGAKPEALGWDAESSMRTRFSAATNLFDFSDTSVLDVGCGFGDFLGYLEDAGQAPEKYVGVDISDEILGVARDRYPSGRFEKRNVLLDPYEAKTFDITVEFGVLNYEFPSVTNEAYLRHFLQTVAKCSDAVLLNILSDYRNGDWEYEEDVHYYSPEKVFSCAQELSRDVVLQHSFEPIPQKEFNILIDL
jgi:SAM-dependent methyltransferase